MRQMMFSIRFARIVALLAVGWLTVMVGAGRAVAEERRVALIIANANYAHAGRLQGPPRDAELMASVFRETLGFDTVIVRRDLNKAGMDAALREFLDALSGASSGVIYYSGHGMEIGGVNYLLPVDARLAVEGAEAVEAVRLDVLRSAIQGATNVQLIVIDACRNNVLPTGTRGSKGMVRESPLGRQIVAFATDEGQTAEDAARPGEASPYTQALAEALRAAPGTDLRLLLTTGIEQRTTALARRPQRPTAVFGTNLPAYAGFGTSLVSATRPQPVPTPRPQPQPVAPPPSTFLDARTTPSSTRAPVISVNPASLPDFALFRECEDCPEMVVMPAGTFQMGSPSTEAGRGEDEDGTSGAGGERVSVRVGRFAVGRFPVTRGQYGGYVRVTGAAVGTGCRTDRASRGSWAEDAQGSWRDPAFVQDDRHPVVCVNWDEARGYARWMSEETGGAYRLATEAEYEYVNRGGTRGAYFWNGPSEEACDFANGADATAKRAFQSWSTVACDDGYERTSPVGSFRANPWGLFDTTGNVWSWVQDCYRDTLSGQTAAAYSTSDCSDRVLRGGSWSDAPQSVRSADRGRGIPANRNGNRGFRLARTL